MTSYQRLKQRIAYYQQCEDELRTLALELAKALTQDGKRIPLFVCSLQGDSFITPYNTAEFSLELSLASGVKTKWP